MAELKPCPFCNCSVCTVQDITLINGHRYWYIRHTNSDCILGDSYRSQLYTTKEKLTYAWNTRKGVSENDR